MCATTSIEALTSEAETLTREIEGGLLTFASSEAREEWFTFRVRWLSTPAQGGDDGFAADVQKLRRFRTILEERSRQPTSSDAAAAI